MFTNPGYNGIYCNLRPCAAAQKINEVKNMFLSVILTIAAAYMALQCGLTAFSVPFASWTWLSWLYLDEDIDIEAEAAKAEAARLAAQAEEAAGADAPDGSADDGESGEAAEEEDGGDD